MKLGQALSVFEAALPEERRRAVPRGADQAAGGRAAAAGAPPCTRCSPASSGRTGASRFAGLRRRARRGREHRPGAPGGLADGRDVAVKIQYPGAGPALLGDLKQLSRLARMFSVAHPRARRQAAARRARGAGRRGARLPARGRGAARPSPRRTTATRRSASRGRGRRAERVLVTEWMDGTPLSRDHPRRHARGARPRRRCCWPASCSPGRCSPGCCTPTRTPATSGCCPTAGSGVIDFGAVDRLPDGSPEPIGRLARLGAGRRGRRRCSPALRAEGFVKAEHRGRRAGGAGLPAAAARARCAEPTFRFTRAWLRAQAPRLGDPRSPAGAARPPAEPAAGVPAHPPGDDRDDRRAVPARRRGAASATRWRAGSPGFAAPGPARALDGRGQRRGRPPRRPPPRSGIVRGRGGVASPSGTIPAWTGPGRPARGLPPGLVETCPRSPARAPGCTRVAQPRARPGAPDAPATRSADGRPPSRRSARRCRPGAVTAGRSRRRRQRGAQRGQAALGQASASAGSSVELHRRADRALAVADGGDDRGPLVRRQRRQRARRAGRAARRRTPSAGRSAARRPRRAAAADGSAAAGRRSCDSCRQSAGGLDKHESRPGRPERLSRAFPSGRLTAVRRS